MGKVINPNQSNLICIAHFMQLVQVLYIIKTVTTKIAKQPVQHIQINTITHTDTHLIDTHQHIPRSISMIFTIMEATSSLVLRKL